MKVKGNVPVSTMKAKEGVDVLLHSFVTLALGGGE
jgi:hypothetical protein